MNNLNRNQRVIIFLFQISIRSVFIQYTLKCYLISRYSVVGTKYFTIDKKDGTIRTLFDLDREQIDSHSFTVVAVDSSEFYPLTGSATVSINILDKNDNTPEVGRVLDDQNNFIYI